MIANGSSMSISEARLEAEFLDRIGDPYGLDGLVLLVEDCSPEAESYLDDALVHYGLADAPGVVNSDAVIWFVCEDPRFVGFFWGADNAYADSLDDDEVADAMVDNLRDGNFTGAIADGFDVVAETLGSAEAAGGLAEVPSSAASSDNGVDGSDGSDGGSNRARDALLIAVAGAGGWWWWRRRRARGADKSKQAEDQAPDLTAAMQPREAVEHRLNALREGLRSDDPNLGRLVLLYEPMGDEAMLAISRRHEDMIQRLHSLEESVAQIPVRAASAPVRAASAPASASTSPSPSGSPSASTGPDGGSDAEVRADALYREALDEANALYEYVAGLPGEADHAEMLMERAAVLAVEARKSIDRSRVAYGEAADDELPPADGIMNFPTRLADRSEAALSAGDRLQAGELAEDADETARAIVLAVTEFRSVAAAIDKAAIAFDRVDEFAQSSWSDIAGNGSEAEESLDAARDMFKRVIEAEPSAFGEDEAAGFTASLRRVFEELTRARNLAEAIEQRLARILEARDTASGMLDSIAAEVDEARTWLEKPEVDQVVDPSPQEQLGLAEKQLALGRAAMAEVKPDWIEIRRALHESDRLVDAALGNARDQQARMEALRRQVTTAREEAQEALEKVDKYVESHRRDVGVQATDTLRDARETLRRVEGTGESPDGLEDAALAAWLEESIERWRRVRELADAAYAAAAEDIRAAESRRQAYVPRPTWVGPSVPIPRIRRSWPSPFDFGGGFGGSSGSGPFIAPSSGSRSPSRSSWGSRPSGGGGGRSGGSRPSSGRRGGGRGW